MTKAKKMIGWIAVTAALLCLTTVLSAAPLLTDDFNYSGLLTANGWTAHSGAGTNSIDTTTGLTYSGYISSGIGNAANVDNTGEDVNRTYSVVSSGPVYVSFMLNVQAVAEGYFLHIGPSPIGTTFRGRVWVTSDGTGDYELGLTFGSEALSNRTSLDLAFNTTYLVVMKYDIVDGTDNDTTSLYVFSSGVPSTEPGTAAISAFHTATQTDISPGSVALRQYSPSQRNIVDGIRVATTWIDAPLPATLSSFEIK